MSIGCTRYNLAGSSKSLGTFCLLSYKYCEFGHTILFTYCFWPTISKAAISLINVLSFTGVMM